MYPLQNLSGRERMVARKDCHRSVRRLGRQRTMAKAIGHHHRETIRVWSDGPSVSAHVLANLRDRHGTVSETYKGCPPAEVLALESRQSRRSVSRARIDIEQLRLASHRPQTSTRTPRGGIAIPEASLHVWHAAPLVERYAF